MRATSRGQSMWRAQSGGWWKVEEEEEEEQVVVKVQVRTGRR